MFFLILISWSATANIYCVSSSSALQQALNNAAINRLNDEIRIVRGIYRGNFSYTSAYGKTLQLLGGYNSNCSKQDLNPSNTIIDGKKAGRVLRFYTPVMSGSFVIKGLTIRNGETKDANPGGGLWINTGQTSTGWVAIGYNRFETNYAASSSCTGTNGGGGGAYISASGDVMIAWNTFSSNKAACFAGGLDVGSSYGFVNLTNNIFKNNISIRRGYGSRGGGAYVVVNDNTAFIANNIFAKNVSYDLGGGLFYVAAPGYADVILVNNDFVENSSQVGGGVFFYPTLPTSSDVIWVSMNIFWKNVATSNGSDFSIKTDGSYNISPQIYFNNFNQTYPGGYSAGNTVEIDPLDLGSNNLYSINPLFVNPIQLNYRLLPGSPMIDAGGDNTPASNDLDNNPRIVGKYVDIGAYEYQAR